MPYPDLVWTVLASIGGLLLIEGKLSTRGKWGVGLIYAGFLFQVYWEVVHQVEPSKFVWNATSQTQVGFVTLVAIISIWMAIRAERRSNSEDRKN